MLWTIGRTPRGRVGNPHFTWFLAQPLLLFLHGVAAIDDRATQLLGLVYKPLETGPDAVTARQFLGIHRRHALPHVALHAGTHLLRGRSDDGPVAEVLR